MPKRRRSGGNGAAPLCFEQSTDGGRTFRRACAVRLAESQRRRCGGASTRPGGARPYPIHSQSAGGNGAEGVVIAVPWVLPLWLRGGASRRERVMRRASGKPFGETKRFATGRRIRGRVVRLAWAAQARAWEHKVPEIAGGAALRSLSGQRASLKVSNPCEAPAHSAVEQMKFRRWHSPELGWCWRDDIMACLSRSGLERSLSTRDLGPLSPPGLNTTLSCGTRVCSIAPGKLPGEPFIRDWDPEKESARRNLASSLSHGRNTQVLQGFNWRYLDLPPRRADKGTPLASHDCPIAVRQGNQA